MKHHLQPLRVPCGFTIEYNDLHEVDPANVPEDDRQTFLKEDLLQIRQERFNRLLDVGWFPSGNLAYGAYRLVIYEGDFRGKLLLEFRTPDRMQLVAEIERRLQEVCDGKL